MDFLAVHAQDEFEGFDAGSGGASSCQDAGDDHAGRVIFHAEVVAKVGSDVGDRDAEVANDETGSGLVVGGGASDFEGFALEFSVGEESDFEFGADAAFGAYQGTNVAVDAMVIPANAKNPELANVFIRYMLGYEASLANSTEVGYASANAQALAELSGPGGEYEGNEAYLPRMGYEKDEVFVDLPAEWQSRQPDLWERIKIQ